MKNKIKSKISVIIIGIIVAVYSIVYGAFSIFLYKNLENPFLLLYGTIPLIILIGIIIAVKLRIKEIDENEIEKAKKY